MRILTPAEIHAVSGGDPGDGETMGGSDFGGGWGGGVASDLAGPSQSAYAADLAANFGWGAAMPSQDATGQDALGNEAAPDFADGPRVDFECFGKGP